MSNRVPTNILTGFLGVGKTTTILNLLKNKPENENWAVLVNEFGEIGIDGAMMTDQGAMIKEVPGAACAARQAYLCLLVLRLCCARTQIVFLLNQRAWAIQSKWLRH